MTFGPNFDHIMLLLEFLAVVAILVADIHYNRITIREARAVRSHLNEMTETKTKYYSARLRKISKQAEALAKEAEASAEEMQEETHAAD